MIGHHQGDAKLALLDLHPEEAHLLVHPVKGPGGVPTQGHEQPGLKDPDLGLEVREARLDLPGLGIPVPGRATLEDIGDVQVGFPVQAHLGQESIQELACSSHEGFALLVLFGPWGFAHEHQVGVRIARAEHILGFGAMEVAAGAS